jgi:hypothetical protein
MPSRRLPLACVLLLLVVAPSVADETPRFTRHVQAVFSRLGCNGGTCHGAVKGQNGFALSLFGADPVRDHEHLLRGAGGRRLDLHRPEASLLLRKATGAVAHQGGRRTTAGSPEHEILRRWITAGAPLDSPDRSRVQALVVRPARHTARPGDTYRLAVEAKFSDGSTLDVTRLCTFQSLDPSVASVTGAGLVSARSPGEAALIVRYRAEPALAMLAVPRARSDPFPGVAPHNFIDRHILARLSRLAIPPAGLADDATFLRRASLDVAGELPAPAEVRGFLVDTSPDKRARKIDELLARPGHAALWTLKFCDLLRAADFGVYADGIRQEVDAPRFQAWVRARLEENLSYDQFVERILTATSRDGRDVETWAREVVDMEQGYAPGRPDLEMYRRRRTLDLYWQRSSSAGVAGALQVAHAFLGLRLECAQCHRHPHDVWQQDDLLSFANFFMGVRKVGFQGDNEKNFPEVAAIFKRLNAEAKSLGEEAKKLRSSIEFKKLDAEARKAKTESARIRRELTKLEMEADKHADRIASLQKSLAPHQAALAKFEEMQTRLTALERRSRSLPEAARRLMHAEVRLLPAGKTFATVTSPIGTQSSRHYRLLGEPSNVGVPAGQDPRQVVMAWLRKTDNPFFARAIVNRVWAHYFGRGIVDPPDNLSPFNPPSHPELLDELCKGFIDHEYDLKWLHRTILACRTYQQSSTADRANEQGRASYAFFAYRRLPAEVLLDALNQVTGTTEKMDMQYFHWPTDVKAVEVPYPPRNAFVRFMLEQFGKPKRNAAVQCDCERDGNASVLQVLALANHPRVLQKIADERGTAARIAKEMADDRRRVEELFLIVLGRLPTSAEQKACVEYLARSASPVKGCQGLLWSLLNTREFVLQH